MAKNKKPKLPKKVGGVKLPKQLRKSAGVMAEIAQSPVARDVVSAALVAGASALARRKLTDKPAPASGAKKPDGEFAHLVAQGQEIGNMITQGINAFVGALLKPSAKAGSAPHAGDAAKPAAAKPAARKPATKGTARKPAAAKRAAPKAVAAKPAIAKPATVKRVAATKPRAKPDPKPAS